MKNRYSWALFLLVLFDTIVTIVTIKYFGADEANPLMKWLLLKSVWLFCGVKMCPVVLLIGLARRVAKEHYIKIAFWSYMICYLFGLLMVNWKGLFV